jgi:hypothetical protein
MPLEREEYTPSLGFEAKRPRLPGAGVAVIDAGRAASLNVARNAVLRTYATMPHDAVLEARLMQAFEDLGRMLRDAEFEVEP